MKSKFLAALAVLVIGTSLLPSAAFAGGSTRNHGNNGSNPDPDETGEAVFGEAAGPPSNGTYGATYYATPSLDIESGDNDQSGLTREVKIVATCELLNGKKTKAFLEISGTTVNGRTVPKVSRKGIATIKLIKRKSTVTNAERTATVAWLSDILSWEAGNNQWKEYPTGSTLIVHLRCETKTSEGKQNSYQTVKYKV